MSFKHGLKFLAGTVAGALVFSGCSALLPEEKEPTTTSASPEVPAYVSDWPGLPNLAYAPLSGELVDPSTITSSALSAKVDNQPQARPQWGISRADIVWEEQVEGGLTRLVAMWHSDVPKKIGPVRSIRPMDPDIISPVGGIVAYSGGKQKYVRMMQNTPVRNAIHGYGSLSDIIYRDNTRPAPHNVQVDAQELIAKYPKIKPPAQQFAYAFDVEGSTAFIDGKPAKELKLRYSSYRYPSYKYDAKTQTYLRLQEGKADYDAAKVRNSATNIVVIRVKITMDGNVPKTELLGSGKGYILTGGKAVAITWSKSSKTAPIVYKDAKGLIVRLAPGTTWVHPVPTAGTVSFS